jgi:F0F1-type ATP synthase assembly protein I
MGKTLLAGVLLWMAIIFLVISLTTKNAVFLLIALPIGIIGLVLTIWREIEKTKKTRNFGR